MFKQLLETAETPTRRCRYLRIDRGGENKSTVLEFYCKDRAISMTYSGTEQHKQNSIAGALHRVYSRSLFRLCTDQRSQLNGGPMCSNQSITYGTFLPALTQLQHLIRLFMVTCQTLIICESLAQRVTHSFHLLSGKK